MGKIYKKGDKVKGGDWEGFEIISTYSRADAIADGFLVDVSGFASQLFKFPVAVTRAVWDEYVQVPEGVTDQDEKGRLWDILNMLFVEIKKSNDESIISFQLYVRNDNRGAKPVILKSIVGPGDSGEGVITIMKPEED